MALTKYNTITIFFPQKYRDVCVDLKEIAQPPINSSFELRKILDLIYENPAVGRVGEYDNVIEFSEGQESFFSKNMSNPTFGGIGKQETINSIRIQTFISPIEDFDYEGFIENIANLHPWEYPMIECTINGQCYIWSP